MKKQWNYEQKAALASIVLWFAAGLLAGVLLSNIGFWQNQEDAYLWGLYTLENMKNASRKTRGYFNYLLMHRYSVYLAVLLSSCTPFSRHIITCFLLLVGFSFGFLSGSVFLLGGMSGIVTMWAAMMPHALCYIPAKCMLLFRIYCMKGMLFRRTRQEVKGFFLLSLEGIALMFLGILAEYQLAPELLKYFLQ